MDPNFGKNLNSGFFFGHFEKNSSPKKLKTQAKSGKKLKQSLQKTQKPPTRLEFNCPSNAQNLNLLDVWATERF